MRFFKIDNIDIIDLDALVKLLPGGRSWNPFSTQGRYISAILASYKTLDKYGINTPLRIAHFIGQGLIETGFLRYASESLNYSAERLRIIFPKYVKTDEQARQLHRKQEAIANLVYGGRLGNTEPGDGWKYRGRGFFQLTGRNNYRHFGEIAGIDLENNPEILEKDLKVSVQVAAAYFAHMKLGEHADRNDGRAVSRGVNLGNPNSTVHAHGEAKRLTWTANVLELFTDSAKIIADETAPAQPRGLSAGARGPEVKDVQEKLAQLGFDVGTPDGIFGQKTSRAVVNFQVEYGLEPTGVVDEKTMSAIDRAMETNTRGNVDAQREARPESEIRREAGTNDGVGAGGAIAGAGGAAGVAYETGTLDEVIEAGKEVLDNLNPPEPTPDPEPEATPPTTDTTSGTEVPSTPPPAESVPDKPNMVMLGLLIAVALIGLYIFLRVRRRNRKTIDAYRDGRL